MKISKIHLSIFTALIALTGAAAAEDQYLIRVPANVNLSAATPETPSEPISVILSPEALPAGTVGEPYSFNLADRLSITGGTGSYNLGDVAWSLKAGDALPTGLSLSNGTIAGTPTVKNEAGTAFEVTGTYQDASGQQVYTIVVDGSALKVKSVDFGYDFACALTIEDTVQCWGQNNYGQLGDGTQTTRLTPAAVSLPAPVRQLSTGYHHACVVLETNSAMCWGANGGNYASYIGNGSKQAYILTPALVHGLHENTLSISAGESHSCAVLLDGTTRCWGLLNYGGLGDGVTSRSYYPVVVSGLNNVSNVKAAEGFSCALSNGEIYCWGSGGNGRLGDGSGKSTKSPVKVQGLAGPAVDFDMSGNRVCARIDDGRIQCWGHCPSGRCGLNRGVNDAQSLSIPSFVVTSSNAVLSYESMIIGAKAGCGKTTNGQMHCWGALPTEAAMASKPVSGELASAAGIFISRGVQYNFCITDTVGRLFCQGNNGYGQLGDGTTTGRNEFGEVVEVLP